MVVEELPSQTNIEIEGKKESKGLKKADYKIDHTEDNDGKVSNHTEDNNGKVRI